MKIFYIPIVAGIILFCLLAFLSKPHWHEQIPPVAPSDDFRVLVKFSSECLEPVRYELSVDHITSKPVRNLLTDFGITSTRAVFRNRYDENGVLNTSLAPSNNYSLEGWRVDIPQKPSHIVFVPHTPCTNLFVLAYFNEINPPISQVYYQWSGGDHVFFPQGESSTWFQTKGPLAYTTNLHVSAQNICGSNILTQLLTVQECGGGGIPPVPPASDPETPLLVISPNPAGDYIDVSINNVSQQLQDNEVYVMTIYDRFSQAVRNVTTDVPHVRIPVYNLPTGTYVLSVVSSDQVRLHGKFIIQR